MADSVVIQFRKIVQEDFASSATADGATTTTIMGIGDGVPVHAFIAAANDAAAAALNCAVGQVYWSTTLNALAVRLI
jgi:hypothetical protein